MNGGIGIPKRVDILCVNKGIPAERKKNSFRLFLKYRKPIEQIWGVSSLQLRDPYTSAKWFGKTANTLDYGLYDSLMNYLFRSQGVGIEHGKPISFHLLTNQNRPKSTFQSVMFHLKQLVKFYFRHYLLGWLFIRRPGHLTRNLTAVEKTLYTLTICLFTFALSAEIRGYNGAYIYVVVAFEETISFYQVILFYIAPTFTLRIVLVTLISIFAITLHIIGLNFAGKHERSFEDALSYWQGREPIKTASNYIQKYVEPPLCLKRKKKPIKQKFGENFDTVEDLEEYFEFDENSTLQPSRAAKKV